MLVFAQWHGGANYAPSSKEDREVFASLRAVKDALHDRRYSGHWTPQSFTTIDGATTTALTPCVDESSYFDVYATADSDDMVGRIEWGPRDGIRTVRA